MSSSSRSTPEIFGLSFLDVLCCGLGAVLTLLLLHADGVSEWEAHEHRRATARRLIEKAEASRAGARARADAHQSVVEALRREGAETSRLVEALQREVDELQRLNFLGIRTQKKRVLLVIDLSGSLYQDRAYERLADVAQALVDATPDEVQLGVLGFRGGPQEAFPAWPAEGELREVSDATRLAAKAAIRETVLRFTDEESRAVGGGTPTLSALRRAFEYENLGAIVLLTDGAPDGCNEERDDPATGLSTVRAIPAELDALREVVRAERPSPHLEIHCVGIGPTLFRDPAFRDFLRALAAENGDGGFLAMP